MNNISRLAKLIGEFKWYLIIFTALNLLLYIFIIGLNNKVKFHTYNYRYNAHHYFRDDRESGDKFNLFRAMGQYDAQWYLKIATEGYPSNPEVKSIEDKSELGGISYAFFPLYPLLVGIFVKIFGNPEITAFLFSNVFLYINFLSLIYFAKKHFNKNIALKSVFLLFAFPFSIFYRSYFTETIYLTLLIWFLHFWLENKYLASSFLLGLLNITKANGFLINLFFAIYLFRFLLKKKINLKYFLLCLVLIAIPTMLWIIYCLLKTGDPLYFLEVRKVWSVNDVPMVFSIFTTIALFLIFPKLPFHLFHYSQLDLIMIMIVLILLIKSKRVLDKKMWLTVFALWLSPLLVHDPTSFSRYQITSFPLFIYLAKSLNPVAYKLVLMVFIVILFVSSLYFVNWYWLG